MRSSRGKILFWQLAIVVGVLAVWQWGYDLRTVPALRPLVPSILDPYFVSKPSMIWTSFLKLSCLADRDWHSAGEHLTRSDQTQQTPELSRLLPGGAGMRQ